ncbi:hypothetical protein [Schlesneria sp. T3-172]|uniref:hypothetical protein n=1 Tax=Schlesneria sphaerica TaxID=3373610 RepID=UPI0037CBEADE
MSIPFRSTGSSKNVDHSSSPLRNSNPIVPTAFGSTANPVSLVQWCLCLLVVLVGQSLIAADSPPAAEVAATDEATRRLQAEFTRRPHINPDLLADARVFLRAAVWAQRYDGPLTPGDRAVVDQALATGLHRLQQLQNNQSPWTKRKGNLVRGYVSAVDGSAQPFGLIIPKGYDGSRPTRLDVVLHGSSKPVGMSELRFMSRFGLTDNADATGPDVDYIELHPLGRVENCYRWAGETDVFEAIEAVCRNYNIDRDRIVLRGMSMGASGTWHLGLKHPDRFVALGPYCGYVDTHRFSETPIPSFIKVGLLPEYQELGLHMLDSVDYAANAGVVPAIAAIGGQDIFFQAHVIMGETFAMEGLQMINLISPGTGHVIDPVTHAEQMRLIGMHVHKGLDHTPRELRFVTWTLKYSRCHWIELLGLQQHYARAEIKARIRDDGSIDIATLQNITRFALEPRVLSAKGTTVRIAGQELQLPASKHPLVLALQEGKWVCLGDRHAVKLAGKRPGLQGPIDDAFSSPFLCVRGTGKAWNPEIHAWTDASLRRFEYEWARYMRGDLTVKNDTEVTAEDLRDKHLILFGDPGSNSLIAKVLPSLPLTWTPETLTLGNRDYASVGHAPALVHPSPLAADRYVVINSGHTFHEKDFAAFNYLLFPRQGDWSVVKVTDGAEQWRPSTEAFPEEVIQADYFDENWQTSVKAR